MNREEIIVRMTEARERTLALVEPLSEADLHVQHDVLMSPIIWDLGHIAHFEELWLVRNLEGPVEFGEMPGIYNPFEHPRRVRGQLELPSLDEVKSIMAEIRGRVLTRLASVNLDGDDQAVFKTLERFCPFVEHVAGDTTPRREDHLLLDRVICSKLL